MKCNRNLSGNAVEYRIRLVQRIGAEKVSWLEGPHQAQRYTIDDLKAIKAEYRAKIKQLKEAAA
ncbi:Bacteriophage Lambda NinG protein [compost metagenome]